MKKYNKPIIEINLIESSSNIASEINGSAKLEKVYTDEVTQTWESLF